MKLVLTFESPVRTRAIRLGTVLLISALLLIVLGFLGVVEFSIFDFAGHSGLRTLAAVAITGCIVSAIASWEI